MSVVACVHGHDTLKHEGKATKDLNLRRTNTFSQIAKLNPKLVVVGEAHPTIFVQSDRPSYQDSFYIEIKYLNYNIWKEN